ncbi:magnesium transporter [Bacillus coahuilensis m2-6]|uniref:Magnesium transporter MgtE n=1 Tax=Bacillus coahuilensis p1.1.43 TaxID=1150625 RepID=A0A147K5K8_9BACI|nr:magnesium transporter [Bacillus coahuilensis]KUP04510.1 magnesium transporter [Bacillus coahuilensis m2-6]KUP04902.1 magnesium transporter [Bacillus coahuilensis p1.1.43]
MNTLLSEDQLLLQIINYLKEGKRNEVERLIEELQPYDMAKIYKDIPEKHKTRCLLYMNISDLADMIQELDPEDQFHALQLIGKEKLGKVLDDMDNDDLASLLDDLSPERLQWVLTDMTHTESTIVQSILSYPAETAGRLMTNRFVWIKQDYTVRDAIDKLKSFAEFAETINYLYVVDERRKLVGVVSYRDLLIAGIDDHIHDIMYERVISVTAYTDQEEAAKLIERYDFNAIPVVDDYYTLIGIITVDDIIDVFIQEATEDIEKLSASGKAIDFDTKAIVAAYRRLPWLIPLLFIGLVSGSIISFFEGTVSQVVALTYFMPLITGMTGNTGTQSLAVVVRGLTSRDIDKGIVTRLVAREFGVGILIGLVCGVLITIIAYVWQGNIYLGLVVGLSLIITLVIGTMAGTIIPLLLYKLNLDPAVASGPLITTINDIFSLIVYYSIATWFLLQLI